MAEAWFLNIRSRIDDVQLEYIQVNNGHCQVSPYLNTISRVVQDVTYPLDMHMGSNIKIYLYGCSYRDIVQTDLQTNHGTLRFEFH